MKRGTIVGISILLFFVVIGGLVLPRLLSKGYSPATKSPIPNRANYEAIMKEYKKILSTNPNDLDILITLGNAYFDSEQYSMAIDEYRKALEIDPNNVDVRTDMGIAYRRIGMSDLAIREFKKGIEINPNHAVVHFNLGVVLGYDKEDYRGAIKEWERFLQLQPSGELADRVRKEIKIMEEAFKAE